MPRQPIKQPDITHVTYSYSNGSQSIVNAYDTITLSFDAVSPGANSSVLGVQLISGATPINNIKLGLVDIGELVWTNKIIKYEILDFFDKGRYLNNAIAGVNSSGSSGSINNISVGNVSPYKSQVVHLCLNIHPQTILTSTCLEFKWFFAF